jgi:hypothetical protein
VVDPLPPSRLLCYGKANGHDIHTRVYLACEIECWARKQGVAIPEASHEQCCRKPLSLEAQEILAGLPIVTAAKLRAALGAG